MVFGVLFYGGQFTNDSATCSQGVRRLSSYRIRVVVRGLGYAKLNEISSCMAVLFRHLRVQVGKENELWVRDLASLAGYQQGTSYWGLIFCVFWGLFLLEDGVPF